MMRLRIEEIEYEGSGMEIMDRLRLATFDSAEYPDTESYIRQLRANYIRMTDRDCVLPTGSVEEQARAMFAALAGIGALEILEE